MAVEVYVPKMSAHMEAAEIVGWLVHEGEWVEQRQPILELATDKVVAELEAPASGIIVGFRAGVVKGATVKVGEAIAYIARPDEQVPRLLPLDAVPEREAQQAAALPEPARGVARAGESGPVRATPAARALAKKLSLNLALVAGAGPEGRIKEEDVQAFYDAAQAQQTTVAPPVVPERVAGERLAQVELPLISLSAVADMTAALALQRTLAGRFGSEANGSLVQTAFLVRVVAAVLKRHPRANATWEGGRIRLHRHIHIAVPFRAQEGYVVVVVQDADQKGVGGIIQELAQKQKSVPTGAGNVEEPGNTFTLTDLGAYGLDHLGITSLALQNAVLAVGRVSVISCGPSPEAVALRPMMPLTFCADARCLDVDQAGSFLAEVTKCLEQPYLLL